MTIKQLRNYLKKKCKSYIKLYLNEKIPLDFRKVYFGKLQMAYNIIKKLEDINNDNKAIKKLAGKVAIKKI